jgi:hypothetical protein
MKGSLDLPMHFENGMDYDSYLNYFSSECSFPTQDSNKKYLHYLAQNWVRTQRLNKKWKQEDALRKHFLALGQPLHILVITEPWCGDAAQILPIVCQAVSGLKTIRLKILLRDQHSEVMDNFLTQGTRSIPIFAFFDVNFSLLFQWGPRPQSAKVLFDRCKEEKIPAEDIYVALHSWYAKDKGISIISEISKALQSLHPSE